MELSILIPTQLRFIASGHSSILRALIAGVPWFAAIAMLILITLFLWELAAQTRWETLSCRAASATATRNAMKIGNRFSNEKRLTT